MKDGVAHKSLAGFTVVETMIVLAVTGVLFLIAVIAVGGKQNETEFQQAINDAQSSLQETIAHTSTGDYQQAKNITCSQFGAGITITTSAGPTNTEGTNTDCIFIGKVVQFATQADPQPYITYPVAGLRDNSNSISNAAPAVVAPGSASNNSFPDASVPTYLHNGLSVASMKFVNGATTTDIGAFGIMSSLGVNAGSQQFYLVPISGTSPTQNPANMNSAVDAINANLVGSYTSALDILSSANPNYTVKICFASGTTKQSGLVTIGGNGGDLNSITTAIFSDKTC